MVGVHNLQLVQDQLDLGVCLGLWKVTDWTEIPGGWCRVDHFEGRDVTVRAFTRVKRLQIQVGATQAPLTAWELERLTGFLEALLPGLSAGELKVPFVEVAVDLHGVHLKDFGFRFSEMRLKDIRGFVLNFYDKVIDGKLALRMELQVRPQMVFTQAIRELLFVAGELGDGPLVHGGTDAPAFDGTGYA